MTKSDWWYGWIVSRRQFPDDDEVVAGKKALAIKLYVWFGLALGCAFVVHPALSLASLITVLGCDVLLSQKRVIDAINRRGGD